MKAILRKYGILIFVFTIFSQSFCLAASVNYGVSTIFNFGTSTLCRPGQEFIYTITVSNVSGKPSSSPVITCNFSSFVERAKWTAKRGVGTSFANGTNQVVSGTGNLNLTTAIIPSGSSIIITCYLTLSRQVSGTLSITSTVAAGGLDTDPTPQNNSSTSISAIGIGAPYISSFAPLSGPIGTSVTINGFGFNTSDVVYFGQSKAVVSSATSTSLTVKVPAGAAYENISVTDATNGYTGYSNLWFDVTSASVGLSYLPKKDIVTGGSPSAVATGDFDADGKQDLAVLNYDDNTLAIYRNISTISSGVIFANPVIFATGTHPNVVKVADMDGDGNLDIIINNYDDKTVSIYHNVTTTGVISTASFEPRVNFVTAALTNCLGIGDLDNDGKPEIAAGIVYSGGTAQLLVLNNKSTVGTISSSSFTAINAGIINTTTGSIGQFILSNSTIDNKPDISWVDLSKSNSNIASEHNFSTFGTNDNLFGNIVFGFKDTYTLGVDNYATTSVPLPRNLAIGDLDGDGIPDIAITYDNSYSVDVLKGITSYDYPLADVANGTTSSAGQSFNYGFLQTFNAGVKSGNIIISDLDGDGKPDLTIVGSDPSPVVSTLINQSPTASTVYTTTPFDFAAYVNLTATAGAFAIAAADLDGDGKTDLVVTNKTSNNLSIFSTLKKIQTITFAATATKNVGDDDFSTATASSGLPVAYSSDNTSVATIVNGNIHIVGPGTVNITASQNGDATYLAAANVVEVLTVNPPVEPLPDATITAGGPLSFCTGASVSLTAANSITYTWTYQWLLNGSPIIGATANTYTANQTGSYTVTVTNSKGQSVTSTPTAITVQDLIAPTFTTTTQDINAVATGANGAVVNFSLPTAIDNCTINPAVTAVPASGSLFPIGTTLVTVTATDASGNSVNTSFNVVVSGLVPVIVVPANFDVNTSVGTCTAIVNFAATDPTGAPASTITYSEYGIQAYSGYMYDVGTHTITATATNAPGSSSNTFTFTVHDITPPQFTSSATILTANVGGAVQATSVAGAVVNFTLPSATDNCANAYVSSVPVSGSVFPLGVSTVVVTATDPSGNSSQTTFTVTVVGVAPSIVVPSTVTVNNKAGLCSAVVSFAATDPTGVPASTITYDIQPGSVFNVGTTKVTATATNELGSSTLSFDVVVKDTELPIVITQNPTIYLDANGQATLTVAQVDNGSRDNCAIASKTISKSLFDCSDIVKTIPNASALKFNGSGLAYIPSTIPGGNNFSFSTWFYANDASNGKIISSGAFEICLCGNSIEVYTPSGAAFGAGGISLNRWHNIVVSYSFHTANVYIDGNLSFSFNAGPIGGISGAVLGRHVNGCCPLIGTLDEMSFWNITLSAIQIAAMQTKALKGDEAGLTAYYNFDEASGTTLIDRSGNHHNAVMQGMSNPWTTAAAPITTAGSNTVILSVTDASGNIATGTATVTVLDAIAPTITCQENMSVAATSVDGAEVNYTAPVGTDNCSATTTMIAGLVSGSVFPIGTTTVTYRAVDPSGNKTDCSFTVTVSGLAPSIIKPADISVASPLGECGANVSFAATETTGIPASVITYTEDGSEVVSGANFSVGVHTITATATNAIGSTSVDFTITVIDDQLPTITAPADITINNTEGHCGAINVRLGWPEVADNCSVADYYPTYHSEFPVGTTDVEWTVVDASGNTATAIQHVTVIDNEKPILHKAFDWGREGATAEPGKCGTSNIASLHLGVPGTQSTFTISDNCGIESITSNAPTFFPVGVTIVTYTVTDIHGNSSTIDEEVTVSDFEPPVIAAVDDITVNATSAAGAVVNYTAPVGTDNCSAATTVLTAGLESGATFPIGTTVITYTVTDATGLTASTSFNVIVTGLAPSIIKPENYLVNSEAGKCGASVSFAATETRAIPASTITYTEDGNAIVSGAYFTVGTHTITATATNAVGSSSVDFTITVVDHELPTVITQAKTIYLDASGHASIAVADINNGSTDNCAIDQITLDKTAFDCSNLGANTVNLTVTDIHGNVNSAVAIVTVKDEIAPVLSAAPADAIVECNAVPTAAVLTATDNCSATVTFTETRINGKSSNDYTLTRTWTATDAAGNSVSKTQTITVQDTKAPTLSVPTNISVNTDNNVCGATITFAATATDNCTTPVITYSQNPGTVFPVGTTTVTVTATDASGNTSTGSFTITVADHQAPVARAKNITLGLGTAVGGLVNLTAAQIDNGSSDACGIASMTVVPASFGCSNVGANTVTLTVTDVNGNSSTTTAVVTVVDDKGPVPTVTTLPTINGQCYATALTLKKGEEAEHEDGGIELENYYLVAPTAFDNCSGLIKGTTTDALTYYNQGDHVITWKFVDAKGNVTTQEQHVIIKDSYAPVPKRETLPTLTGQCSVSVASGSNSDDDGDDNDGGDDDHGKTPWAKDNCSGWIKGTTTDPLTYNVQGTYTITWSFNDGHGNISTQTQTVIVKDVTKPRINAPKDKTVTCGSNILPAVTGMATATDNCSTPVITFTDVNANNLITRTWTATDAAGNTSSDVQTIKLTPAFSATVSSTPTSTVYTGGSNTNLYLGYGAQSTKLSVNGLPIGNYTYVWTSIAAGNLNSITSATPIFTATAAGVYTFTVTISNGNGCSNTASVSICVTDIRVAGSNGALVYVCHQGTNKSGGTQTLQVPIAQVAAHLNNTCGGKGGDRLGSCSSTPCNTNTDVSAIDPKTQDVIELTLKTDVAAPAEDLKVTVMPNPSTTYFTLKFESKDLKTPISLRVMDASGRAIDSKQHIDPSSTIQIGYQYPSGTFYAEVIQGTKRKVVQMIKARG